MDYRDYIKEEHCDVYVQERDNLTDGLIDAKCNLLFLKMCIERDEMYRNNNLKKKIGIDLIAKKIYTAVAWQLALQIKAFTDDNDKDCLTVNKFKNNIFKYIKEEKKDEYYTALGVIKKTLDWNKCEKLVASISDYRNKIIGHNIVNAPDLTFDINAAEFIIQQYEGLFNVLSFQYTRYVELATYLDNEVKKFIAVYLDAVLPLN